MEPTALPPQPVAEEPQKPKNRLNPRAIGLAAAGATILLIAGVFAFVLPRQREQAPNTQVVLTEDEVSKLAGGAQNPDRTLTIAGNGVFKGSLTVERDINVVGKLNLTGNTAISQLEVSGPARFNDTLTVAGSTTIQGPITIGGALSVAGNGSFGGTLGAASINVGSLTASQLTLGGHLRTGGGAPTASVGAATGGGGANVQGNDTAGTVTITTGSGGTGTLVTIRFRTKYGIAPRVTITPVGSTTANLRYYVDRNADFFTIGTITSAAAGASYVFDYHVTE